MPKCLNDEKSILGFSSPLSFVIGFKLVKNRKESIRLISFVEWKEHKSNIENHIQMLYWNFSNLKPNLRLGTICAEPGTGLK